KKLLGVFIVGVFYFVLVYHLTHLYFTGRHGVEYFVLAGGGIYTVLFWAGYMFLGTILPLLLLYHDRFTNSRISIAAAALLTIIGGISLLYVIIIGGQVYPVEIFPGKEIINYGAIHSSTMYSYTPSIWEIMLGVSGIAIAAFLTVVAVRILPFMPRSLADTDIDETFKD
ncbi:MAG TPA: molybdopterin oxidoreductase, partial [Thioploca sp.]|nr:molybdopterin oxidoreductase [Thioploca sp.]